MPGSRFAWDGLLERAEADRLTAFVQSVEAPRMKKRAIMRKFKADVEFQKHIHRANRCAWIRNGRLLVSVPGLDPFGRLLQLEAEAATR